MATALAATEQRARTPLGLALLGLAGALLAVLAIGWYGAAAGYVHAERLDHPTVLTLAAGAAATVGLGLLLRGAVRTVVVLIGLGATTLGCAGLFALVSVLSASTWDDAGGGPDPGHRSHHHPVREGQAGELEAVEEGAGGHDRYART